MAAQLFGDTTKFEDYIGTALILTLQYLRCELIKDHIGKSKTLQNRILRI